MSKYKDTYELYQSVLDEVHASDELKQRIKEMDINNIKETQTKNPKMKKIKFVSAIAACLVVALLVTFIVGSFSGGGNSFVLKASAAEIGGDSFVKIATVAPVSGESGGVAGEFETINAIIPFAVKCDGNNIKSIKYSVKNAVFLFPYNSFASEYREQYPEQASASDKITNKTESDSKIESSIENDKQYSSYTVSFDDQVGTELNSYSDMDKFPIQLMATISSNDDISGEAEAAFDHLGSDGSITDESFLNETLNDFKVIYNEMYSKVSVTAEVTYEDGTTDSSSLRFSCLSADMQNGIVIGAKTV